MNKLIQKALKEKSYTGTKEEQVKDLSYKMLAELGTSIEELEKMRVTEIPCGLYRLAVTQRLYDSGWVTLLEIFDMDGTQYWAVDDGVSTVNLPPSSVIHYVLEEIRKNNK